MVLQDFVPLCLCAFVPFSLTFAPMSKIKVKIVNQSVNPLPEYATNGSVGVDLRANITEKWLLRSGQRLLVPTGIFIELPDSYEAQVRPRSGLAIRSGITCLNTPGTIDSDYRGEIKVILINLSQEEQYIEPGDRIAQMVFAKVEKVKWKEVKKVDATERNDGGFGHTGKK